MTKIITKNNLTKDYVAEQVNALSSTQDLILGRDAANIFPSVISRMKYIWLDDYKLFLHQDLSHKNCVYFWVDGIYLEARM